MTSLFHQLRAANPSLNLLPVGDPAFKRYGRLLTAYDPTEMMARASLILPRAEGVAYEPSVRALEAPSLFNEAMQCEVFGGMPIQVGWCYGHNVSLDALEYHRGSEVDLCLTDVVLLVGHVQDICWGEDEQMGPVSYDTAKVAAFFAPAGAVVELSPWNLHYAPIQCRADQSFATLVYLPKGTNEPLSFQVPPWGENRLLFAVNKWLLAHPSVGSLQEAGAYPGLAGENITVTPVAAAMP
ncbi:MAG: DUF4867 family protein [Anaerolineales bacterium]